MAVWEGARSGRPGAVSPSRGGGPSANEQAKRRARSFDFDPWSRWSFSLARPIPSGEPRRVAADASSEVATITVASLEDRAIVQGNPLPWALTVTFAVVAGVALTLHEPWRNEVQAWLLARDSASPLELIRNLKTEGHPGLWHLLLMPLTRISGSPAGMQVASLIVGTATVWVFARFAPFPGWQKVLFAFGYFPLYEYTTIARNYGLGLLLLLLACALFRVRYQRPLALAVILFLACHTSAHAMLVAAGLGAALALDFLRSVLRSWRGRGPALPPRRTAGVLAVLALIGLGALSAFWQLSPPGSGVLPEWQLAWDPRGLRRLFRLVLRAFVPLSPHGPAYWRPAGGAGGPWLLQLRLVAGAMFLLVTLVLLARRRSALIAYAAASAGLLHLFYGTHLGGLRHHGFLFVAFVVACWLAEDDCRAAGARPAGPLDRWRSRLLGGLLVLHVVAGASALYADARAEFSVARRAAAFLRDEGLAGATMVVEPDATAVALIGYLEKDRVYFPRSKRWGSFVRWDPTRLRQPSNEEVLRSAMALLAEERRDVVLVLDHPLPEGLVTSADARFLGRFESGVVKKERFFLYLLTSERRGARRPAASGASRPGAAAEVAAAARDGYESSPATAKSKRPSSRYAPRHRLDLAARALPRRVHVRASAGPGQRGPGDRRFPACREPAALRL